MSNTDTGIGAAVKRREDLRFLTGRGKYTDDINRPHQTFAYMLRSPHASAKIKSISTAAAQAAEGVVAVFTGADLECGSIPCGWLVKSADGSDMKEPPHPPLAKGAVHHVGDQVAVVIAETLLQAKAAAALIDVDYDVLPAVIDMEQATAGGAAVHDEAPDNICFDWVLGDAAEIDAALAASAHRVSMRLVNNRLVPNAMGTALLHWRI